jgi:hypothetical protein
MIYKLFQDYKKAIKSKKFKGTFEDYLKTI